MCSAEPARIMIENFEVRLIVDMHPFAAGGFDFMNESLDQSFSDTTLLMSRINNCVEDERVHPAVPTGVDEPDQLVVGERTDPRQAVPLQARSPRFHLST
ncbi:hypothetical protein GCM10010974_36610 [Brevibacterium sediminis]|uniref:Uncharacterized protein n=1 Tax=Brevibacterium sediminis TaxID=1857024 RepID=A0ABQ1N4U6_9MICO|nr:hypothetical protein GCM10010974_36610 [Brevibacterium sediminis]